MKSSGEYAIPLFSLIDGSKVDLSQPLPEQLGDQLAIYLEGQFGINALSTRLMVLDQQPFLVLYGVEDSSLPALCSLVDVQHTQLFRYQRSEEEVVTLTPLNVKLED